MSTKVVQYLLSFNDILNTNSLELPTFTSPDDGDDDDKSKGNGVFLQWDIDTTIVTMHMCARESHNIHGHIVVVQSSLLDLSKSKVVVNVDMTVRDDKLDSFALILSLLSILLS